ncbi:MAG: hypothetical protein ABIF71_04205 [Planctomycetota bacterium]
MGAFAAWKATNTVRQGVREDGRAWKMENSGSKFLSSNYREEGKIMIRGLTVYSVFACLVAAMVALVSAQDKLPGGVSYRLREADKSLMRGERAMAPEGVSSLEWKTGTARDAIRGAQEVLAEIEKKFAGQYSPDHPDIAAIRKRIADLEAKIAGAGEQKKATDAAAADKKQADAPWIECLKPYVTGIGQPEHDKNKYLIASATQDATEMAGRLRIYIDARAVLQEYKKSAGAQPVGAELQEMVDTLAKMVGDFEKSCVQYADRDLAGADTKLKYFEDFVKEQETKMAAKESFLFGNKDELTQIQVIINRGAGLVKPDDSRLAGLRKRVEAAKATDSKLREAKVADTRMKPDQYAGGDLAELKKTAESVVKKAHTNATILKVTIVIKDWAEESVIEYTDTTQTALRHRVTRSLTAQVAAKEAGKTMLYTLDINKDKRTDGSFGELKGHIMFQDPILEQSVK